MAETTLTPRQTLFRPNHLSTGSLDDESPRLMRVSDSGPKNRSHENPTSSALENENYYFNN